MTAAFARLALFSRLVVWFGAVATAPLIASAQSCIPGGTGGLIPASGSGGGGTWPVSPPPASMAGSLSVVVPAGATRIEAIRLNGLTHTWVGDVQLILADPGGGVHNVLHRPGFTGAGFGLSCDLAGDYTIVESAGQPWPATCPGPVLAPGSYNQDFGNWPSGSLGVVNTALSSIPISSGVWILGAVDWEGGDSGALVSWELCFDTGSAVVQAGSDLWNTPGLGCSYQEFPPGSLPANFFGAGSNPWPGGASFYIGLIGVPLAGSGMVGNVDTIVERLAPANLGACGTQDTVPIQIKALSLASFKPVNVNFGGNNNSKYDVVACLDNVAQPLGSMTIRREHANGGTFDSTLPVIAHLTFTKVSGASGVASATLSAALITFQNPGSSGISACWAYDDGGLGIPGSGGGSGVDCNGNGFSFPATSNFFAGVCYPGADCNNSGGPPDAQLTREAAQLAQHCILPVALPPETTGYCYCSTTQPPSAPCGNFDPSGGCRNSTGQGMRLDIVGPTNVTPDTATFSVTGGPPNVTAVLLWGTTATFGHMRDGQLCVFQPRRTGVVSLDFTGARSWTNVAFSSLVPLSGDVRTYQVWYRNAGGPCLQGSNLSNAHQVFWLP